MPPNDISNSSGEDLLQKETLENVPQIPENRPQIIPEIKPQFTVEKPEEEENDPFDTSGIIIPDEKPSIPELPTQNPTQIPTQNPAMSDNGFLSQLVPFISPQQSKAHKTDDLDSMLPQLTSPLSPPPFNPHEIVLDTNEAIAGRVLND